MATRTSGDADFGRDCHQDNTTDRFCRVCGSRILAPYQSHWAIAKWPFAYFLLSAGCSVLVYFIIESSTLMMSWGAPAFAHSQLEGLLSTAAFGCGALLVAGELLNAPSRRYYMSLPRYAATIISYVGWGMLCYGGGSIVAGALMADKEQGSFVLLLLWLGLWGLLGLGVLAYVRAYRNA